MLTKLLHQLSMYSAIAVSASVQQISQANRSLLAVSSASADLVLSSNATMLPSNDSLSSSNILKLYCNAQYGRDLKVKSCRDLFGYLKLDDEQLAFAQRDSGISHDIPLPLRTYSSKLIVLRLCNTI